MLRNVQPVVPTAVQNQPRHQTVTGLTRTTIICSKIVAPLLMVKQRVERIHVHVVTAGPPSAYAADRSAIRRLRSASRVGGGPTTKTLMLFCDAMSTMFARFKRERALVRPKINVKGRRSNNEAVIGTGNEAAARLPQTSVHSAARYLHWRGKVIAAMDAVVCGCAP